MPLAVLAPAHEPLAVQDVGLLVALQDNVDELPTVVEIGFAFIVTTGAGGKVTVSGILLTVVVPPLFAQDKLYK